MASVVQGFFFRLKLSFSRLLYKGLKEVTSPFTVGPDKTYKSYKVANKFNVVFLSVVEVPSSPFIRQFDTVKLRLKFAPAVSFRIKIDSSL